MTDISRVLFEDGAERWYGDGKPRWRVGPDKKPPESAVEADSQSRKNIRQLRKRVTISNNCGTLADLLEACWSENRCGSLACRKCGRAMQRCFVNAAQPWIKGLGEPVYIITIVPDVWFAESERCLIGKLSVFRNRLDAALKDADIKLAVGWYDVSLNEHSNKAHRPFWQPHLWCIVPSSQVTKPVREVLRKHFPNNPLICAAVEFQLFDGNRRAMAYGAKPNFIRRVTYPKIAGQNSRAKRRQNTKKRDLRVSQNQAMLLMCHDLGFSGRLFLHGATVRAWNEKIRFSECVAPV